MELVWRMILMLLALAAAAAAAFISIVIASPVALAIGGVIALTTPALAVTRQLWNGDRDPMHVHMLAMDRDGTSVMYLWTETATSINLSERVLVDPDPGSGPGDYRLTQVHDAATIDAVCTRFREYTQAMIDSEIARGSIPRFAKRIPFNLARCEQGALWETMPVRAG
jgi:hypothetical protein